MKNKIILGATAILVLLAGTVLANGYFHDFDRPEFNRTNATELRGMSLHGNPEQFFNETRNNTLAIVKQKLGLPANASREEIKTALDSWAAENRELLWALGPMNKMPLRGMPMRKGW